MPEANAQVIEDVRALVKRALSGDQHAMLKIVEQYKQRVYGLCYRMLGQREDAEDVSQEAFIRVLKNLPRWDQERAFEPWLLTIAANRCRTRLAQRKRREPLQTLPFAPSDDRWSNETAAGQLLEEVDLALAELPEKHARAFTMFHRQQMPYADIAAEMGVPQGTVKTWVHRARNELMKRLVARQVVEKRHAV